MVIVPQNFTFKNLIPLNSACFSAILHYFVDYSISQMINVGNSREILLQPNLLMNFPNKMMQFE